ncbi:MAG: 4-vinyl reductase [Oscillochloridaceae bacterium umkhey_bin13]
MADANRATLGSFMSLTCFQYLRVVAEETAGRALVVSAGRKRGQDLVEALGLVGSSQDPATIKAKLNAALAADGTKLCIINSIATKPNGGFEIHITEGACTAGVTATEPHCAFTMGVFIGAVSAITGQRMLGHETECCAMGKPECIYQIDPIS